jgi:hypothetical protein
MKKNKLVTALALSMSLTLISCSNEEEKNTQATKTVTQVSHSASSGIMNYIPADTPLLVVWAQDKNHPIPENLKNKMENVYSSLGKIFKQAFVEGYNKQSNETNPDHDPEEINALIEKWFSDEGMDKLGLSMDENEMALYLVDLFPVVRFTLGKSHAMPEVLDELMTKVNEDKPGTATKQELDGHLVYKLGDKEYQVVISLSGNNIAATITPTNKSDSLTPKLLGFELPSKNIKQSAQFNDTVSKYNYIGNNVTWVNIREIADYFVNPGQHKSDMLDMLKIQDNMLSADCKTEILGLIDKAPRIVGGSTKFGEHEMASHMMWEMDANVGTQLSTLTGRIPTVAGTPELSYGFSFDIAAAKNVAMEFVTNIQNEPFKCEYMFALNEKVSQISEQLNQPLPPFVGNFKGMNVIIDKLDLDLSQTEPDKMIKDLKGSVLLAVDNPEALKGMAEMMMPELQKLGLVSGGDAVNISELVPVKGTMIPINLDHLFMAMGDETIGIALGEGTNMNLKSNVSGTSEKSLFSFGVTAAIYKNIFNSMGELTKNLPEAQSKQMELQKAMMSDMLWWEYEKVSINFTEGGMEILADIDY